MNKSEIKSRDAFLKMAEFRGSLEFLEDLFWLQEPVFELELASLK